MLRIATCYECHRKEAVYLIHIDKDQVDASRVAPLPQTTGMVYHQNDRNAYEAVSYTHLDVYKRQDYNLDMAGMNANEDTLAIQRTLRMKDHNIELGKQMCIRDRGAPWALK